eukprot:6833560-Alexandrium_andersonii.AAC.1
MSASLVGSEMCIRDRFSTASPPARSPRPSAWARTSSASESLNWLMAESLGHFSFRLQAFSVEAPDASEGRQLCL